MLVEGITAYLAADAGFLHQSFLRVVDELHHMLRSPLTSKLPGKLRMCMTKDSGKSRNQPARDDANLLHETLFDPKQQLIGLLQQAPRSHSALAPTMPALEELLLLNRLLKHGLQPTISVPYAISIS